MVALRNFLKKNVYVALTCIYYNKLSVTTGLFYSCYITHEKIIVLLHLDVYNIINYVQHYLMIWSLTFHVLYQGKGSNRRRWIVVALRNPWKGCIKLHLVVNISYNLSTTWFLRNFMEESIPVTLTCI